jgi:hypothetical protein
MLLLLLLLLLFPALSISVWRVAAQQQQQCWQGCASQQKAACGNTSKVRLHHANKQNHTLTPAYCLCAGPALVQGRLAANHTANC